MSASRSDAQAEHLFYISTELHASLRVTGIQHTVGRWAVGGRGGGGFSLTLRLLSLAGENADYGYLTDLL